MSGDVSKVVAFLQEHAKYVDVRDKPMVFRAAALLAERDALRKVYDASNRLLQRMAEDGEVNTRAPETDALMDALDEIDGGQFIALTDQGRAGEGERG